jgi:ABC-type multidrug transport system ATPase subunit
MNAHGLSEAPPAEQARVQKAATAAVPGAIAIYARGLSVAVPDVRSGEPQLLLDNISLTAQSGSFVGLIGPSGCGKSTLLTTLAGIRPASRGELLVGGYPVTILRREFPLALGYLPQFAAFHDELTVRETLAYAAALRLPRSVSGQQRNEWLDHIVELARLERFYDQPCRTLSGGQRRRVALAEELVGDPQFLFLDELTSGLDPHSEEEMMLWLADLAGRTGKTVVLVTHAVKNLHLCNAIIFLHRGRLLYQGSYDELLGSRGAATIEEVYRDAERETEFLSPSPWTHEELPAETPAPQPLRTAKPPGGFEQMPSLVARQTQLLGRDRGQLWLQLILLLTFPTLVTVFASSGLPQVRKLSLGLESNALRSLTEQLYYLKESFHAASLISGLTMFQVILLTLMGANNGAREIAKERAVLEKELRAGLSPGAYITLKFCFVGLLSLVQAFWMSAFVKVGCGFPGSFSLQFSVLFLAALAMSCTCLAISAFSPSPERASLLSIYLVGLQLPLSGAILALPETIRWITRPVISAYWGWSGYLRTLEATRHYDVVREVTNASLAPFGVCLAVLALHSLMALAVTRRFVTKRNASQT